MVRRPFDAITSALYVGECPQTAADVRRLKQETGVEAVLTLQTEDDHALYQLDWPALRAAYARENISIFRCPILDRNEQSLQERLVDAVQQLDAILARHRPLLLHCNIGNGRSPTVATAWLSWCAGWDLDEANDHVVRCRPCQPNLPIIRQAHEVWLQKTRAGPSYTAPVPVVPAPEFPTESETRSNPR